MIYFIHGPDRLLAREAAAKIVADVDPDGANTSWIDGREATLDQVISAVGTVSFFSAPRVVVLSDHFRPSTRNASEQSGSGDEESIKATQPKLEALLSSVPTGHCLIIIEPGMPTAPAAVRTAKPPVTIIAAEPPRGTALLGWIEEAAQRAESRIDRRSAQYLAESLFPQTWDRTPNNPRFDRPPDLALLSQEIAKLALAAHPHPIAVEHIQQLVAAAQDQRVFRFQDAALGADLGVAMTEMERLVAAGEEPAMMLNQLLGQIELTAVVAAAGSRDASAVARDLGTVTPGRMSAVMASTRRQSSPPPSAVTSGAAVDRAIKTGRIKRPVDAVHTLVLELASKSPR